MDLDGYQKKIDDDIIKAYKNYDPATKDAKPTAKNVVGAINTFEKEIGGIYNDTTGKITNLKTLHKDTIVDAVNEIGYLPDLEMYDAATAKPDNLVDAINLANADMYLVENQTIDRTKYVDTYKLEKDPKDGSPRTQMGDTAFIPRVDVDRKATADTGDFRTYEVKMAGDVKDANDTTNKLYGTIHIPKIQIKKIEPVTDPSLAAEYYLSIEDGPYSQAISGAKIELQKDLVIKDAGVKECETAGVPLQTLAVGEKYLYLEFEKADGSSVFAYIACKDLITESIGEKAIKIDYDSVQKKNIIKLVIHDPDGHEALIQTDDGLRIMDATTTQYGVVEYATDAEVLTPSASTSKATKPIDLYNFATKSESVKEDLGNIYQAADGTKPNDTITKAISELTTVQIEERAEAAVADTNIKEYQFETIPVAGVKRQLGDAIEIPKSIVEVDSLAGVAEPKEYMLYYLTQDEAPYDVGLYKHYDTAWYKIGQDAIVKVEALPTANIKENCFYELANHDVVLGRYSLTDASKKNGYHADAAGIHYGTTNNSWGAIKLDWADWIDDEIVADAAGPIYMVKHADDTEELIYQYTAVDNALYYHYEDEWIEVSPVFVDKYMDADKNFIINIDADELKPQTSDDEGKTFVVNDMGEWQLDKIRNYLRVSTFTDLEPDDKTLYYLDVDDNGYDAGLYIYDEDTTDYIAVGGGKAILQIDALTDVTDPKELMFYEVKNDTDDAVELYVYRGTTWHKLVRTRMDAEDNEVNDYMSSTATMNMYLAEYDKDTYADYVAELKTLAPCKVAYDEHHIADVHFATDETIDYVVRSLGIAGEIDVATGVIKENYLDMKPITDEDIESLDMMDVDIQYEGGAHIWQTM